MFFVQNPSGLPKKKTLTAAHDEFLITVIVKKGEDFTSESAHDM